MIVTALAGSVKLFTEFGAMVKREVCGTLIVFNQAIRILKEQSVLFVSGCEICAWVLKPTLIEQQRIEMAKKFLASEVSNRWLKRVLAALA